MVDGRVVVGAIGDPAQSARTARALRDAGWEVIYLGGQQTPEQLVRTAVAEDCTILVVDGDRAARITIADLCAELDAVDIRVMPADWSGHDPRSR